MKSTFGSQRIQNALIPLVTIAVLAGIFGFLGYLAFVSYFASQQARLDATGVLTSVTIVRYGVVVSSDPNAGMLTISSPNTFSPDEGPQTLAIKVPSGTPIVQETLSENADGVYDTVSSTAPGTLSDITLGTHVRAYITYDAQGDLTASGIVFGDPL